MSAPGDELILYRRQKREILAEADNRLQKADNYERKGRIRRAAYYCGLSINVLRSIEPDDEITSKINDLEQKRKILMHIYSKSQRPIRSTYAMSITGDGEPEYFD